MSTSNMNRRAMLRTLLVTVSAATLGRAVAACSDAGVGALVGAGGATGQDNDSGSTLPNDQDEHVPGTSPPVDTGDEAPKVPSPQWEARARQLENEQTRLFVSRPFVRGDAGVMTGKENSHEPKARVLLVNGKKKVEVTVEHVMGKNGLDGGSPGDAGKDAADSGDAARFDGGDGGRADGGLPEAGPAVVHFITTVFLRAVVNGAETVVGLWEFNATDPAPPTVQFTLPAGVTSVVAYEWCTLHGLWRAPALMV